jgi:hypothetical protein
VALVSHVFHGLALSHAETLRLPDARLVVFDHPLAGTDEAGIAARADAVVDRVIERFLA